MKLESSLIVKLGFVEKGFVEVGFFIIVLQSLEGQTISEFDKSNWSLSVNS
jgi:hypothetical protein